jgi:hypothetical protein
VTEKRNREEGVWGAFDVIDEVMVPGGIEAVLTGTYKERLQHFLGDLFKDIKDPS